MAEDLKPAINVKSDAVDTLVRGIGKPGNFGFAELKEIFGPVAASYVSDASDAFRNMGAKQQVVADLVPVVSNGRGWRDDAPQYNNV